MMFQSWGNSSSFRARSHFPTGVTEDAELWWVGTSRVSINIVRSL
jgi:hypothetical protein